MKNNVDSLLEKNTSANLSRHGSFADDLDSIQKAACYKTPYTPLVKVYIVYSCIYI